MHVYQSLQISVYMEVKYMCQEVLSSRWVMTEKFTAEERKAKAMLVCNDFKQVVKVKADSPQGGALLSACRGGTKESSIKRGFKKNTYMQGKSQSHTILWC